jgi:hypothetical protein
MLHYCMKIRFASTFYRLNFFKWGIWKFFRNIYDFRRELWSFRSWDYSFNLMMLKRSLEMTLETIRGGHEVETSKNKKIQKIERTIEILDNICSDNFLELAEKELKKQVIFYSWNPKKVGDDLWEMEEEPENVREWNRKIYNLADQIREDQWIELWTILRGQDMKTFKPSTENPWNDFDEWFDGSGLSSWWD